MLEFRPSGIFCKPGQFYIDPWLPVDKALITHGHADHARWGMKSYLCHHYTVPILQSRISADINVQGVGYNEPIYINGVKVTFHPAGHIIGSAQIRLEYKGKVTVVTGDYKLQNDGISTPFESVKCHELITESTFGLPIYNWSPVEILNEQIQQWALDNIKQGKTPIFIGYSLGKAQRLLQALKDVAPIHVHYSIDKLNKAYQSLGIDLAPYAIADLKADLKTLQNKIIILPPSLVDNVTVKKIPHQVYAICSGWMQVRGARRWRSADAGFAISDHADWKDLLTAIKSSEAEKVFVTHGQTHVLSKYLNEIGIEAEPVVTQFGQEEDDESVSKDQKEEKS